MLLTHKNEVTVLYSGECRNTYFEIKRSGGNGVPCFSTSQRILKDIKATDCKADTT